jgi:phosphatidylinositol-3-phosphatase
MMHRFAIALAAGLALLGAWSASASADVPQYNHVFIVVLENENAGDTFGDKTDIPYLAKNLTSQGAFVKNYYGTGHFSLDNYISMVSGQAPNPYTQADCPSYANVLPGVPTSDGQVLGIGCVYPNGVQTIANQLEGNGLTWKGYMQDMGNSAPAQPSTCRHPAIGSADNTQTARATDQYAARHNPFVYFHSIIDFPTCQANDVDLNQLTPDLTSLATTPSYAFISPDLCNDGHDMPCADGGPGGMKQANTFLKGLIPQIMSSPAYRDRGLIIVTFDEAEAEGAEADSSACCNEQPGPNTPSPGGIHPGPGGGRVGAVMVSNCIQPGTVTNNAYNHYSLLRSVEDNFRLPHLGYAGQAGLKPFGTDILNQSGCPESQQQRACRRHKRKKHKKHKRVAEAKKHKKKAKCKKHKKKKHGGKHKHAAASVDR